LTTVQFEVFDWSLYKHQTKTILAFFGISFEDWERMVRSAALRSTEGDLVEQENLARTKLANIHMYLSADRGGKFHSHDLGKAWLNGKFGLNGNKMEELNMTPREALAAGHLDEVLEELRKMERVK